MANEIRRRYNFKSGTITDNPLTNSATTMNSTNLAGLPAIGSTEYAVLVLDPAGTGNGPEVVYVTAHTGSATSATIVRGREGTTAVQHSSNVTWIHVATAADYPVVGDDNDQPSGTGLPYEGQLYVDTTNDEIEIYNGSAWMTFPYGAWQSYTPTVTQSGTVTKTVTRSVYTKIGRTVFFQCKLAITGSGTSGNNITVSLPVTAVSATDSRVGQFDFYDSSVVRIYHGSAFLASTTTVKGLRIDTGAISAIGNGDPATGLASGDEININIVYEAAS